MTTDRKHALWNAALEAALVEDDWLGRPKQATVATAIHDVAFAPEVNGIKVSLAIPGELKQRVRDLGEVEYIYIEGYHPLDLTSVYLSVFRSLALSSARRAAGGVDRSRVVTLECSEHHRTWQCVPHEQYGDACPTIPGITLSESISRCLRNPPKPPLKTADGDPS